MKFIVDKKLFDLIPDVCFGVIIARDIDNSKEYPDISKLLDKEIDNITKKYSDKKLKK